VVSSGHSVLEDKNPRVSKHRATNHQVLMYHVAEERGDQLYRCVSPSNFGWVSRESIGNAIQHETTLATYLLQKLKNSGELEVRTRAVVRTVCRCVGHGHTNRVASDLTN
jgi:hypothetical protein